MLGFKSMYEIKIKNNNIVKLPKIYIEKFDSKIVILKGIDNCLLIYPEKEFLQCDKSYFDNYIVGNTEIVHINSDGTFKLSNSNKELLGIDETYIVYGMCDHIEIFSALNYKKNVIEECSKEEITEFYDLIESEVSKRAL